MPLKCKTSDNNTYEGMPRSPASPHLAYFNDSPHSNQSDKTWDTRNVPALAGPPYGHDRLHTETAEYGISMPVRRQHIRQLSELIDPTKLMVDEEYVKSPSGNLLGHADFCAREDRPLSLRERQERIRQQLSKTQTAVYAVNGIDPSKTSPTDSAFSMYDIPEEQASSLMTEEKKLDVEKGENKKKKKTQGCWCFCF
ncbi:Protein argonaute [Sphaceloma murrayae]|uniref:Protein argonaute n=1 Tax=Sphaceloma murrayae TaxID=2082308 RepID=A0A2K1QWC5_9PEZI|nr:Protein argonaute [Sphaceloma murrayae]